jgi:serine acetyltransferase
VSTKIGANLVVHHGVGLVVHPGTIIGDRVTLRQNTTIGDRGDGSRPPVLGNDVNVGPNVVILGPITVGAGATIGAGAVVVDDVSAGETVVGNPARSIPRRGSGQRSEDFGRSE